MKSKKIILISGMLLFLLGCMIEIVKLPFSVTYFLSYILIIAVVLIPALLVVLKPTNTKLPILSSVISSLYLAFVLISTFLVQVPNYLLYSEIGWLNIYLYYFMNLLKSGFLPTTVGVVLILISTLLIRKEAKQKKREP